MPTNRKAGPLVAPVRTPRNSNAGRSAKKRPAPADRSEKHIGATEDQVMPTLPPKADDDEPKQG